MNNGSSDPFQIFRKSTFVKSQSFFDKNLDVDNSISDNVVDVYGAKNTKLLNMVISFKERHLLGDTGKHGVLEMIFSFAKSVKTELIHKSSHLKTKQVS